MQESNFILTKRNEKIKDPIVFGYSCIFIFKKFINWRIYGVAMYIAYENILTGSTYDRGSFPWVKDEQIHLFGHPKRIQ
jgi:hypothetical protein